MKDYQLEHEKITRLQTALLKWYAQFGREFPWREESATNYSVIIAEILLQRTKAVTVAKYYSSFLKQFPSWEDLSNASEAILSQALRPFGLNRLKAKRLYLLAATMKEQHWRLPESRNMVEELSLFGQYTANAFELFVLKKPSALLDVNMARLLERYFEPRKNKDYRFDKRLKLTAAKVVDHPESKEINWAILDFAALVCTTQKPKCDICPIAAQCNYLKINPRILP